MEAISEAAVMIGKKMKKDKKVKSWFQYHSLMVWPLIVGAGRLAFRVVMNIWDMIEP